MIYPLFFMHNYINPIGHIDDVDEVPMLTKPIDTSIPYCLDPAISIDGKTGEQRIMEVSIVPASWMPEECRKDSFYIKDSNG